MFTADRFKDIILGDTKINELDVLGTNFTTFHKDDILGILRDGPTIDYIEDEEKMDLRFDSSKSIWVYLVTYDGQMFIRDKSLVKKVMAYESPNTALALKNNAVVHGNTVVKFSLDVTSCLDLLNLRDMKRVRDFYYWALKNRKIKPNISDVELISLLAKYNADIKSIRVLHTAKQKLHKNSKLNIGTYIYYRVLDESAISKVEILST